VDFVPKVSFSVHTHNFITMTPEERDTLMKNIADIQMKIAAMQAALTVFGQTAQTALQPAPIKEYFGGPKKPDPDSQDTWEMQQEVAHKMGLGITPDASDTDSVLSEKEQREQDALFERIVVKSHEEGHPMQKVADLASKPGTIRWYKLEAIVAFRDEDWHADIGTHLLENVQEYLDQFMEHGGVIFESYWGKSSEYCKACEC